MKSPPFERPGYRWERKQGCACKACPWKDDCKGQEWPHWVEVKDE